jgi:hypothetical protein
MPVGDSTPVVSPDRLPAADGAATPPDGTPPLVLNGQMTETLPAIAVSAGEPLAPADLVPAPGRGERLAWYAGAWVATCLLVFFGLQLNDLSIRAPLAYDGDALLIMPMVKSTLERGSHWRIDRMGYPGVLELHDFPVIDHLHFAIIWLVGLAVTDWVLVYNLYYLLTYPLAALTAMLVLRHLRLTLPMAAAGGVLFAFLPYHYLRGEAHYFLSAYWMIPLSWLPALAICRGDFPFFERGPGGRRRLVLRRPATLWQVLLAGATASAGAYYAFFACLIYAFAGAYGWVRHRTWKAAASAAIIAGLVSTFGIVNHVPAFAYSLKYGQNSVTERRADEADYYGLKIAQMILPVGGHNLTFFGKIKSSYNFWGRPIENENACATLGLVGTAGLLILLGGLVFQTASRWPYRPLAALAGFIVLFCTVGGFGSVFNLLVFDQIRCLNRISVYLAFICLFAALWPLDRFLAMRTGWARRLRYPAIIGLTAVGIADQTPTMWFSDHIVRYTSSSADRFLADQRFFGRIEQVMPAGSRIFTAPYIPYPEEPPLFGMNTYEHARGYLHTGTLVWSYGAMKNREVDAWQRDVSFSGPAVLLHRIVVRGFDGIVIDKRGFPTEVGKDGETFLITLKHEAEKNGQVRLPMIVHEDGRQVFLDLRPYRDWLRAQDPNQFEIWERQEREWVAITWLKGFYPSPEPYEFRDRLRFATKSAIARIVNPSDRTRVFLLEATFGVETTDGPFRIRIDGGGLTQVNRDGGPGPWTDDFTIEKEDGDWGQKKYGVRKLYVIQVPPGGHIIRFRCDPPFRYMPDDTRPKCYYLRDIFFVEVK